MSTSPPEVTEEERRLKRAKIYAMTLTTIFVSLGVVFAVYNFPDLHPVRAAIAGACFGGFLALCSITYSAFM